MGEHGPPAARSAGQGGVNGHDSSEESYRTYPSTRPFINTDYQRSSSKPISSFPESNRDGVMSALRGLQERMRKLEVERKEAENNLQSLATETERYKASLQTSPKRHANHRYRPTVQDGEENGPSTSGTGNARARPRDLESQLSSAEIRCQLLEKQLEYMRKMVQTAEHDRTDALHKAELLQQQQRNIQNSPPAIRPDYQSQLERIGELERDHLRLTATQTLAESKIKELENKLKEERDHRKMLQERALDLESAAVSHQILLNSATAEDKQAPAPASKPRKPPVIKKKKKKPIIKKRSPVRTEPTKHYRLNLADIPFVAGKSTGPSHAVGANVQKVLAMMKSHNLALCSSLYNGQKEVNGHSSPSLSSSSNISLDQDLADLLAQLQDEFGQLSLEHQEYMRQIEEARDLRVQEDLERELDSIVLRMEAKAQQISRVRQHQQKLEDAKRQLKRASKKSEHVARPNSAMGRLQTNHKHHHSHHCGNNRPKLSARSAQNKKHQGLANPALSVLKDMRKLQCTLRCDDLCWE